jgi:superfamily I DNA/RNA helicase/Zn-dependent peptidase ImmA (M78 family)
MDSLELIRDSATTVHSKLVANGVDPLDPDAMVQAAIQDLDLVMTLLPQGDAGLKGARALFDDQSGTICCEITDSVAERATLIAHELGHVCIHSGSTNCSGDDIDPSRSMEVAPVGLQRVEDYGARERRELQANIFAREFLLPRAFARRLHIDDGMGANAIADRTGLSKNLVRQQLFDALLLPSQAPHHEDEASTDTFAPDPSQDKAAAHRGSPFQLQAGPGTGKTRTVVKRVLSLISEGVDPASILVLTFSNRAAGELSERIATATPDAAPRIWIGTFHAFGLDLVRRYHDKLRLSPNPSLFDRSDAIEMLEEILPTLPLVHYRNLWDPAMVLRDVVTAIGRAKDELVDPIRYRALAIEMDMHAGNDDERIAAEKCLEIAQLYDLYEKAMRDRGGVDFGDLIMRPTLLLEANPDLQAAVRLRHRHIVVDEYQDVNRASGRLLRVIAGDGKRLWVVGDSRQSIYRFRGASSANMAEFGNDFADAKTDQLSINYRSTQEIVNTFVSVAGHMGASHGMLPLALTAMRGHGSVSPQIRRYETLDNEVEGLAASIREVESAGMPLRKQAVLCRTNGRLNEIASGLEERGIPVLHLGSLFEREEVRDLLAILSLAVDPFADGLARVGAMSRYNLSLQDVSCASRNLRAANQLSPLGLSTASKVPGLSSQGSNSLAILAQDFDGIAATSSAWDLLSTYLLDRTDLARSMSLKDAITDKMRSVAVWQFLNFVRDQSRVGWGLPIQRTLDRVRQLVLLAEERDLRQVPAAALHLNAVRLMTVHGSKGLEFEVVHVPGLTVASFPSSNRGQRCPPPKGMIESAGTLSVADEGKQSHDHEEECLFFVALSRARTHLRLYLARRQPNGNNRSPSPFLDWLTPSLVREVGNPTRLPLPANAARSYPILVQGTADRHVTDSHLSLYEKCPRRFFYTHVLGLGGKRKTTAFSQTHDCIYDLIHWLSDARRVREPSLAEAETAFNEIWKIRGPVSHGFAEDYRRLASRLLVALIRAGEGRRFRDSESIAIDMPGGRVMVEPNELAELPNGAVILRRIHTGYKRSDENGRLEYTLYHLAGQARFGNSYSVEAVHLTDEVIEMVTISSTMMNNRRTKSNRMLADIAGGHFPTNIDAVTCPRCPHFFICAATPHGALTLT